MSPTTIVYRMAIPGWRPTYTNELLTCHHMQANRLKCHDADVLARAKLIYGVPDAVGRRRVRITIRGAYRRFPDPDSPLKSILDSMKTAHLIVDDSAAFCCWEVPVFERGPKETVLEIEELTGC